MSLTVHNIETAPEGAKEQLAASQKAFQFIPNLHGVFAGSPQALEAYKTLTRLFVQSSLTTEERHIVWLTINVENECDYCIPAHSMLATMDKVPANYINAIRSNEAVGNEKLDALRNFTIQVVQKRGKVSKEDIEAFLAAGYTQQNILDVLLGNAHKTLSNYTNHIANTPVDAAFASFV